MSSRRSRGGRSLPRTAAEAFRNASLTTVDCPPLSSSSGPLGTEDRLYFAGSCFAENLRSFWEERFLPAPLFPFGSSYNPASLASCFELLASGRDVRKEELFCHRGLWRHSLYNSTVVDEDAGALLERINRSLAESRRELAESSVLVLTLGTAFVYREKGSGLIVNNCHTRPSADFERYALSLEEITRALGKIRQALDGIAGTAPDLKSPSAGSPSHEAPTSAAPAADPSARRAAGMQLILTLSPVRHLRDKPEENSLSKALLRCGIDAQLKRDPGASYFPAYEIMMDELRDYRWYADDLCHPSARAASYIMERFCEAAASEDLKIYLREAEGLKSLNAHIPRNPESPESRSFEEERREKNRGFAERYPFARLPRTVSD